MTGRLPPPTRSVPPRRPWALRISAACWLLAAAAGVVGVLTALADHDALRQKLTDEATRAEPGLAADAIENGVAATTALVLGGAAVLSLAVVVWTLVVLRRRPWARWPLLVTGALVLVADDIAQSTVSGGADVDRIAFLVQAALIVPAVGTLFWRSTGRWLRPRRDGARAVELGQQPLH